MQAESNKKTSPDGIGPERRKRIERLKKMIVITIAMAILIPTVLCIFMGIQLFKVSGELKSLKEQIAIMNDDTLKEQDLPADSDINQDETVNVIGDKIEEETDAEASVPDDVNTRKVYLTFDDGPSSYTDEILDILSGYGVKATFFVVGTEEEAYLPMYQRIVEEGHSIGMHSYSHNYAGIYQSLDSFKEDYGKIKGLIKDKTGVDCLLYRFPGGSSNSVGKEHIQEYIAYLDEEGVVYYDWNVSSEDATGVWVSVDTIVKNCTSELEKYNSAYILLHDGASKKNTVEALPQIIEKIQAMENTEIVPITVKSVPVQQVIKE